MSLFFNVHGAILCDFWFVWEEDEEEGDGSSNEPQ